MTETVSARVGPATLLLSGGGVDAGVVGGKAAALDRLIAADLPIPTCGVVTVDAYRSVVGHLSIAALIDELRSAPIPEPKQLAAEQTRVDEAFLAVPLPEEIEGAVLDLARTVASGSRLAVRSSATAEDTEDASFAGQFRSELGVRPEEVMRTVRQVWASLWHPAPRSYRRARHVDESGLGMAVLVMRMVEATTAGVAFTVDPEGDESTLRIEAVDGLGDKLVSGAATPRRLLLPRDPNDRADQELADVGDVAMRAEAVLGAPQDVEWAADGERVYVVQSRPITTTALPSDAIGDDTTGIAPAVWTPVAVEEMAPGVLPPLLWSLVGGWLEEGFRRLFDDLGAPLPSQPIVGLFRGRAAANLDALSDAATRLPGGGRAEIELEYFGEVLSDEPDTEAGRRRRIPHLVAFGRATRLRHRLTSENAVVCAAAQLVLDAEVDVGAMDAPALRSYRHRLHDLLARIVAAQVATAATAVGSYRALEGFLRRYVDDEAAEAAQRLTASEVRSGPRSGLDTTQLSELIGADELADLTAEVDDLPTLLNHLRSRPDGIDAVTALDRARRRAGSVAIPGGPRWEEDDDLTFTALGAATDQGTGSDALDAGAAFAALERRLTSSWRWRLQRLLTGQIIDVRRRVLRRLVHDATGFLGAREDLKAVALQLGGESRRCTRRAAEVLCANGTLSDPSDVELLGEPELDAALRGSPIEADLAVRRRRHAEQMAADPLPIAFTGDPSHPVGLRTGGDVLTGWAASPGQHHGIARAVSDAASATLEEGDVLVAHTTDPSWTPLFVRAGAIVVEQGGPLSHAAIVARELGKPAVLNLPGVFERIEDGVEITVDGTAGTVAFRSPRGASGNHEENRR